MIIWVKFPIQIISCGNVFLSNRVWFICRGLAGKTQDASATAAACPVGLVQRSRWVWTTWVTWSSAQGECWCPWVFWSSAQGECGPLGVLVQCSGWVWTPLGELVQRSGWVWMPWVTWSSAQGECGRPLPRCSGPALRVSVDAPGWPGSPGRASPAG